LILTFIAIVLWAFLANIPQQESEIGAVQSSYDTKIIAATTSGIVSISTPLLGQLEADTVIATIAPFSGGPAVQVVAGAPGKVREVFVADGQGVEAGMSLAELSVLSTDGQSVYMVTHVSGSNAARLSEAAMEGASIEVSVSEVSKSNLTVIDASVEHVADTPSSIAQMEKESGSQNLAEQWYAEADGLPYRVLILLKTQIGSSALSLTGGQIVKFVKTDGTIHPIEMLFGGN
jgi:hypothetical protein